MATCPGQVKKIIYETGARYSVLFELPYCDAVRFTLNDPVHNIFLGLAKKTLKLWIKDDILNEKKIEINSKKRWVGYQANLPHDLLVSQLINGKIGCAIIQFLH